MRIVTQEGTPVDDSRDEYGSPQEEIRAIAEEVQTGLRKFKNSAIFKIGVIAVALKIVGVAGEIIIENQRLKAALKYRQQREQGEEDQ